MRLARCVLTVLRLMASSSAISALVRPRATVSEHLLLAVGERSTGCAGGTRSGVGEGGQQPGGDARGDEGVAGGGGVHGLGEQLGAGVLEEEAAGAGLEGAVHVLVEVEGGDDDDGERVATSGPASRRVASMPSRSGMRMSKQADVGAQRAGQRDCLSPVARPRRRPRCRAGRRGSSAGRCARCPGRRRPAP